jgi:antirestriction protein ArdC
MRWQVAHPALDDAADTELAKNDKRAIFTASSHAQRAVEFLPDAMKGAESTTKRLGGIAIRRLGFPREADNVFGAL